MAGPDFGLLQGGTALNPNAFGTGMQQGAGLVQLQQQAQDRQMMLADRETAMAEKAAAVEAAKAKAIEDAKRNMYQMQRFADVSAKPTLDGVIKLGIEFPQAIEQMKKAHEMLSAEEQKQNVGIAQRTFAAMESGQPKVAVDVLRQAAEAKRAAGDEKGAKALDDNADIIGNAKTEGAGYVAVASFLQSVMKPEDFAAQYGVLRSTNANVDKARAEADIKATEARFAEKKILADIGLTDEQARRLRNQTGLEAKRLELDREEFNQRVLEAKNAREDKRAEMPDAIRKAVDAAVIDGTAATIQAEEIDDIVKGWEEYDRPGNLSASGARAAASEAFKSFWGSQDNVSALRKRTDALVNKLVVTNLPPGAASEKDVEMVKGGFPDQYAPPEEKAAFLKSLGKVQRAVAQQKAIEADYQSQNFGLTNAKRDLVIDGVAVPAGTPFREASAMVFEAKKPKVTKPTAGAAPQASDFAAAKRFQ